METLEKQALYDLETKETIDILEAMTTEELDYDLTCLLARSYNNDDQEQAAKDLLLSVEKEGQNDPLWHYRMGFSCFYLGEYEEALGYLEMAKQLGCVEWAEELLPQCRNILNSPAPENADKDFVDQLVSYLDCPCALYNPMKDDDPMMDAYREACELGKIEGFVPMLISADDKSLWESLLENINHERDDNNYSAEEVKEYRDKMLSTQPLDGNEVLNGWIKERIEEANRDELNWEKEIIGKPQGGDAQHRFLAIWNYGSAYTQPMILAKIPVKNSWEVFAYLPFGNWNDCPDTLELMATAKLWYERYGAIPAVLTQDQLEFRLEKPVPEAVSIEVALQHYGFCPDVIEQTGEEGGIGRLASQLSKSTVWSFWWD